MSSARVRIAVLVTVAALSVPLAASAQDTTVTVGNGSFSFEPSEVEVTAGSTITWEQNDAFPHSVTASDGSFDSHPNCNPDGSGDCMGVGDSYPREFTTPGTFTYYCKVHGTPDGGGMAGTVTVTAAEQPTEDPTTEPPATEPPATEEPTSQPTEAPTTSPATAAPTPTQTAAPSLPETGADRPWALIVLGAGLVAGGTLVLRVSRRRPGVE